LLWLLLAKSEAELVGTETLDGDDVDVGAVKSFWGLGCGAFGLATGGGGVTVLTGSGLATGGGGATALTGSGLGTGGGGVAALTGSGWGVGLGSDLTIGFDSILG
jgi:hypothetical protein